MAIENKTKIQILIEFFQTHRGIQFDSAMIAVLTGLQQSFVVTYATNLLTSPQYIGTVQRTPTGSGCRHSFRYLGERNKPSPFNVNHWPIPNKNLTLSKDTQTV